MLRKSLALLLLIALARSVAFEEWMTADLRWGETVRVGNYSLSLLEFSSKDDPGQRVLVELQEDNSSLALRPLGPGESFSVNDSVRVTATRIVTADHVPEPYASLRVDLPAAPEISLLLTQDREVYQGGERITLELWIENQGTTEAEGLKVSLSSQPELVDASYNISALPAGGVWDEDRSTARVDPIRICLRAPHMPGPSRFNVTAKARFSDPDGRVYEAFGGTSFQVAGPLQIHKRIEDRQEFGRAYYVIDSVRNTGNRSLNITLTDETGANFQTASPLSWQIRLEPKEAKTISYRVLARRPGEGLALPQAEASYYLGDDTYRVLSESPVVDVLGPFIRAERTVSPASVAPGGEVLVSIEASNKGNRRGMVSLREPLPGGARLRGKDVNGSFMLLPGESRRVEYRLLCLEEGGLVLPPTEISYRDVWGRTFNDTISSSVIRVEEERPTNISARDERGTESEAVRGHILDGPWRYLVLAILILLFIALGRS